MVLGVLVGLVLLEFHEFQDFHVLLLVLLYQVSQKLLLNLIVQVDQSRPVVQKYRLCHVVQIDL
jgi:hypothetical protein